MRKLLAVLVAAVAGVAVLAGASPADTYQPLTPYMFPTSCGGFRSTAPVVSASESGGLPIRLAFGWGALQTKQLDKFLAVQNGVITITDPNGNTATIDQWGTGDATGWTAYTQTPLTANGTTFVSGWGTKKFEFFGPLSNPNAGTDATYQVNMDLELTKAVNDGFGSYPPGPWIKLTNCPLIVRNYN